MNPIHFPSAAEFRRWLEQNHASTRELWVGFYKKSSGRAGLTYREAVDEALCFGWIDGIIKRVDAERYMHRFTPRKPGSIWSNVNVGHIARLAAAGKMHPAGQAAFAVRKPEKTGIYSFEAKTPPKLAPADEKAFRAQQKAWDFFAAQPPGYRRLVTGWVVNARQEATRERRLAHLIATSAAARRIDPMAPFGKRGAGR